MLNIYTKAIDLLEIKVFYYLTEFCLLEWIYWMVMSEILKLLLNNTLTHLLTTPKPQKPALILSGPNHFENQNRSLPTAIRENKSSLRNTAREPNFRPKLCRELKSGYTLVSRNDFEIPLDRSALTVRCSHGEKARGVYSFPVWQWLTRRSAIFEVTLASNVFTSFEMFRGIARTKDDCWVSFWVGTLV